MPSPNARTSRPPGRPSVADERRAAIVEANIHLIAEHGSPAVPMSAIAERAKVARTAISHFVGDRDALSVATVDELRRRYEAQIAEAIGVEPTPAEIIDLLFSPDWTTDRSVDDRAFDILQATASHHDATRAAVRGAYALLIDLLREAITRRGTQTQQPAEAIAYTIVALAESNTVLLDLGFPAERSNDAADLARSLLRTG